MGLGFQLWVTLVLVGLVKAVPLSNLTLSVDETATEADRFYHSLKKNERIPFLMVELAKGLLSGKGDTLDLHHTDLRIPQDLQIDAQLYEKFQEMDIPRSFHKNLIKWVKHKFGLSTTQIHDICKYGQICAPDGTCFDTGDVGDLCCPF